MYDRGKDKNFVSAVVYVRDIGQNETCEFLRAIICLLEENFEHSEVVCVDDAAGEATMREVREAAMTSVLGTAIVSVVHLSYFHGLELAMDAGVDISIGDYVFEFDSARLDFDLEEVMRAYHRCLEGYDVVGATPRRKERISSSLFYAAFEHYGGQAGRMRTECFRVLSRRAINCVSSMNRAVPYRKAAYAVQGLRTDTITYKPMMGRARQDRVSRRYRFTLAIDSLILFTNVGYQLSIAMTMLMMLVSTFVAAYAITVYAIRSPVAGWTTTALFLSFAFLGLFGILTVIAKYLQILVDLIFRRQRYSFSRIEKLTIRGGGNWE